MESFILVLNIIFAILLIISVLLQKSEGGALGLGVSQESFVSSRSAGNFLTKVTAILAALFIISSVFLTVISNQGLSNISVIEKVEEKTDPNEPEIPKSDQE
tara:strand:+ start:216 stop:521 length:306 start_codon:yes stop_codon:yes gene_type:complete